jgi:hypothetical protein
MKIKSKKITIQCERCSIEESTDNTFSYQKEFRANGWTDIYDGKTLCKKCADVVKNLTPDKLIPMFPLKEEKGYGYENDMVYDYYCPICKSPVSMFDEKICTNCGQRLKGGY